MSLSQEQQIENTNPGIDSGNPALPAISSSTTRSIGSAAKPIVRGLLYKTTSSDYGRLPLTRETAPFLYEKGTSVMTLSQEQQTENANPGFDSENPDFPSMSSSTIRSIGSAAKPSIHPSIFLPVSSSTEGHGAAAKPNVRNVLYKTTSSEYGRLPPTAETAPCSHHPKSSRFTRDQSMGGMYQNNSFNTCLDQNRVHDCRDLQHIF